MTAFATSSVVARAFVLSALGLAFPRAARAEPAELTAHLRCQPSAGPGRILCQLESSAKNGKLVWVDALVVKAPSFARPLRSRVVAHSSVSAAGPSAAATLALVASEHGSGRLDLLVRAVVCRETPSGEWCGAEVVPVSSAIEVGPAAPSGP